MLRSLPPCLTVLVVVGGVLTTQPKIVPPVSGARFSPIVPTSTEGRLTYGEEPRTPLWWLREGSLAIWRRREDCVAFHIRPALTVLQANLRFSLQLPSLFPNLCYFTPQRQTLNCTFIVYKHLRQLFQILPLQEV